MWNNTPRVWALPCELWLTARGTICNPRHVLQPVKWTGNRQIGRFWQNCPTHFILRQVWLYIRNIHPAVGRLTNEKNKNLTSLICKRKQRHSEGWWLVRLSSEFQTSMLLHVISDMLWALASCQQRAWGQKVSYVFSDLQVNHSSSICRWQKCSSYFCHLFVWVFYGFRHLFIFFFGPKLSFADNSEKSTTFQPSVYSVLISPRYAT